MNERLEKVESETQTIELINPVLTKLHEIESKHEQFVLKGLLAQYDLDHNQFLYLRDEHGYINSTYLIRPANKSEPNPDQQGQPQEPKNYYLRVYCIGLKSPELIGTEAGALERLANQNLPTPKLIKTSNGDLVAEVTLEVDQEEKTWRAILSEQIRGIKPESYEGLVNELALTSSSIQNTLNVMEKPSDTDPGYGHIRLTAQVASDKIKEGNEKGISNDLIEYLKLAAFELERLINMYEGERGQSLTYCLNHGDYHLWNLLFDEETQQLSVLDFDFLRFRPLNFCLGGLVWCISKKFHYDHGQERALQETELFLRAYLQNLELELNQTDLVSLVDFVKIRHYYFLLLSYIDYLNGDENIKTLVSMHSFANHLENMSLTKSADLTKMM